MNNLSCDQLIKSMQNSTVDNYVIPGLKSHLLGGFGNGRVRLFEATRNQIAHITPHSHRFHLASLVLQGVVTNHIWNERIHYGYKPDKFEKSVIKYEGEIGSYAARKIGRQMYWRETKTYLQNEWYYMDAKDIHSIEFSSGARVLIFEGPQVSEESVILEPVLNDGTALNTCITESWMFKKQP